jgi:hypothetical protein
MPRDKYRKKGKDRTLDNIQIKIKNSLKYFLWIFSPEKFVGIMGPLIAKPKPLVLP